MNIYRITTINRYGFSAIDRSILDVTFKSEYMLRWRKLRRSEVYTYTLNRTLAFPRVKQALASNSEECSTTRRKYSLAG